MRLVQKMMIGLSLAGSLMMSSCSKEDVQMPEPEVSSNANSSLKTNGLQPIIIPYVPPTIGSTGEEIFPNLWTRGFNPAAVDGLPNGTSNLTHLWGNVLLPWTKPLPQITDAANANSFFTLVSDTKIYFNELGGRSNAYTTIQNLKIGQKYEFKFYVATTILPIPGFQSIYAKQLEIVESQGKFSADVDLTGKEAQWVAKTIVFTASKTSHPIRFRSESLGSGGNKYSFTHIFVGNNAIKAVN